MRKFFLGHAEAETGLANSRTERDERTISGMG
jgi:hypothetical protein